MSNYYPITVSTLLLSGLTVICKLPLVCQVCVLWPSHSVNTNFRVWVTSESLSLLTRNKPDLNLTSVFELLKLRLSQMDLCCIFSNIKLILDQMKRGFISGLVVVSWEQTLYCVLVSEGCCGLKTLEASSHASCSTSYVSGVQSSVRTDLRSQVPIWAWSDLIGQLVVCVCACVLCSPAFIHLSAAFTLLCFCPCQVVSSSLCNFAGQTVSLSLSSSPCVSCFIHRPSWRQTSLFLSYHVLLVSFYKFIHF